MEPTDPFLLVFVCTGNICRSPMAEGIMKDVLIDQAGESGVSPNIKVISAGIHASPGYPASENSVEAAAEDGIDIKVHQSRPFDSEIAQAADLILTMELSHASVIRDLWPETGHVEELKRFGKDNADFTGDTDVMDPIGLGIQVYRTVYGEIRDEIKRVASLIFSLADKKADSIS